MRGGAGHGMDLTQWHAVLIGAKAVKTRALFISS